MKKIIHSVLRRKFLWIFISLILIILAGSFRVSQLGLEDDNRHFVILDENANVVARSPFPPSLDYPMGSERNGAQFMFVVLSGAKYTIIVCLLITALRVVIGGLLGIVLSIYLKPFRHFVQMFFLPFKYIPSLLIAMFIMLPIIYMHDS
jgi:peptide/nickel transport system permease protein